MKEKIIPVIAVITGIGAMLMSYQFLSRKADEIEKKKKELDVRYQPVEVMVAAVDIPSGTKVKRTDLATKSIPKKMIQGRAILPTEGEAIIGKTLKFMTPREGIILWSHIEGNNDISKTEMATRVSSRMRAISINVNGAAGVSGHVRPNNKVDVLGTFTLPSKSNPGQMETVTLTVLQQVTVLATGEKTADSENNYRKQSRRDTGYGSVTLEVTPREAEVLVFAQQIQGRLTLSLRNTSDPSFERDLPEINFEHIESKLPELNRYRQEYINNR